MRKKLLTNKLRSGGVVVVLMQVFFMNFSLFFISPAFVQAQASSHSTSRITVPLAGNTNLVVENSNGIESHTALISDSLASTKVILSSDGTTTATPHYYPYGISLASQADRTNGTDKSNRYYTGQRKIPDTNIYNYNARYYNPDIGLFTQPDSIQGPNRFAYVGGNPIMKNDPTGHNWCEADPWLSPLWGALGQCAQEEAPETDPSDWTQEAGMSSVAELTQTADDLSGGIGTGAKVIGDSLQGNTKIQQAGMSGPLTIVGVIGTAVTAGILANLHAKGSLKSATRVAMTHSKPNLPAAPSFPRTYESVMNEAQQWFATSPSVRMAQQGMAEYRRGNLDTSLVQGFFQAMRSEGVLPVVDQPGLYSGIAGVFHTSQGNLIRTLDRAGQKLLIIHPNLNNAAIKGENWAFKEMYMHGVHDLGAVRLGFHTAGHPHQGLASGFHAADFWFNTSIGESGAAQLQRFHATRFSEFGMQ